MYAEGEVMTFKKQDVGWTIRRFVVKWCPQQIDSPTGNHRPRKMSAFFILVISRLLWNKTQSVECGVEKLWNSFVSTQQRLCEKHAFRPRLGLARAPSYSHWKNGISLEWVNTVLTFYQPQEIMTWSTIIQPDLSLVCRSFCDINIVWRVHH